MVHRRDVARPIDVGLINRRPRRACTSRGPSISRASSRGLQVRTRRPPIHRRKGRPPQPCTFRFAKRIFRSSRRIHPRSRRSTSARSGSRSSSCKSPAARRSARRTRRHSSFAKSLSTRRAEATRANASAMMRPSIKKSRPVSRDFSSRARSRSASACRCIPARSRRATARCRGSRNHRAPGSCSLRRSLVRRS